MLQQTPRKVNMTDNTFRYANAVTQTRGITMNDALAYERELETQQNAPKGDETLEDTQNTDPKAPENKEVNHDWEKRYSDLKSYTDKKFNDVKSVVDLKDQENLLLKQQIKEIQSQPKSYQFSEAEIKEWADQFPDFHKFMDTVIDIKYDKRSVELQEQIKGLENQLKVVAVERGRAELLKLHPDANEIENDPQFISWFEKQEPEIISLIQSPDPRKIAKGLNIYKKELGIVDKAKARQDAEKEASKAITINSKPETPKDKKVWKESEIAKMHPRVYAKYEEEIEQARLDGRFEKDM